MGFIYKVTNDINEKVYIGQTAFTIEERFAEHCKDRLQDKSKNRPLYNAMNKYGIEHFQIEQIEECPIDKLSEREIYWIEYYNSYENGYNATRGGEGTRTIKDYNIIAETYLLLKSKEQTAKKCGCSVSTVSSVCKLFQIETFNNCGGRPVARIDEKGNKKYYKSIRNAAEELSISLQKDMQTIRKRITNVVNHHPEQKAYGFHWELL